MTISNGYATLAEFKARYYAGSSSTTDDTVVENVIEAVSRWIDHFCNRRFHTTSSDETRYFTAEFDDLLLTNDDIVSITTLATDEDGDRTYETTWAATDYDLEPFNASLDGRPYTRIAVTPNGDNAFPVDIAKGVKVLGKFGYSATPDAINEACLIQSGRIFKRKDSPFGVAGVNDFGQMQMVSALDPDVKALLMPFRKMTVGAI